VTTIRILGPGRAGRSLAAALGTCEGFDVVGPEGRDRPPARAAEGVDVLVIATPDGVIADVARSVRPRPGAAVLHLSGSLGLDVLAPHARRGSLHPLVPLPTPAIGAARLRSGATFAVAGDAAATELALALGGRVVEVEEDRRTAYHAAASIAANHLVALLGQVERVAAAAHLPLDAFSGLVRAAVDDAFALGPGAALTGPAARGDWGTIARHRDVLGDLDRAARNAVDASGSEVAAYDALVALARRLAVGPDVEGLLGALAEPPQPAAVEGRPAGAGSRA
jgi:predicted short-subunit dehydrogenase-like oxidoreductase (DUF2520 family)